MVDRQVRGRLEASLDHLHRFAFTLTQDRENARDLVQECAVRALAARRPPASEAALRPWLFVILRNAFIDGRRRAGREIPSDLPDRADDGEGWHGDHRIIDILTIRLALGRLGPAHREIIGLVDMAGLSYAETAEVLDIAQGTVMSRLSRARKALFEIMSESNVTPLDRARGSRS